MKKLLNLIALGLVSALLVGCMRDGKDGNSSTTIVERNAPNQGQQPGSINNSSQNNSSNSAAPVANADKVGIPTAMTTDQLAFDLGMRVGDARPRAIAFTVTTAPGDARGFGAPIVAANQGLAAGVTILYGADNAFPATAFATVAHSTINSGIGVGATAANLQALDGPADFTGMGALFGGTLIRPYLGVANEVVIATSTGGGAAPFTGANAIGGHRILFHSNRTLQADGTVTGTANIWFRSNTSDAAGAAYNSLIGASVTPAVASYVISMPR